MIFLLFTGTFVLIFYISNIQRTQKYSAVMSQNLPQYLQKMGLDIQIPNAPHALLQKKASKKNNNRDVACG